MITVWGFALGLPLLAFGGVTSFCVSLSRRLVTAFERSKVAAAALTAFGWFWTAYECDTIGIDVFDAILLKEATGGVFVWALAAVLSYLTVVWMPRYLLTRSIMGLFMLMPAELFKITRPMLPESGFAPVQVIVAIAYVLAAVGMFGMFYPWRIEAALKLVWRKKR